MSARHVNSFKNLDVYQLSRALSARIFDVSKTFPREEMFSLTDQARRSSRAIGAAIAEAWGKRRYVAHFINKLTDADAEQQETQHWIDVARDCGYIDQGTFADLIRTAQTIGKMLQAMMDRADTFCLRSDAASNTDH